MSTRHILSTWYTGTPDEDVILVRNMGTNPIGSCIYKAPGIKPGETGYQTRATVERFPSLVPVKDVQAPAPLPPAPAPQQVPEPVTEAPRAAPVVSKPADAVLGARELAALIAEVETEEGLEQYKTDPRPTVKKAVVDRLFDLRHG